MLRALSFARAMPRGLGRPALASIALGGLASGAAALSENAPPLKPPRSLKVCYGDMHFWRAEVARLALYLGDVPFEDVRIPRLELKAQGRLPFGMTPIIEADGKTLSQTQAIASYCGKLAGIHPAGAWEQAKCDEVINGCTDVTVTIGKTFGLPAEEKVAARQALIGPDGRLRMVLGGLERICEENGSCGHAVGDSITVADVAIWRLVGWVASGVIDGIPKEFVSTTFPAVAKVVGQVDANPKVQEWKSLHAKHYQKKK